MSTKSHNSEEVQTHLRHRQLFQCALRRSVWLVLAGWVALAGAAHAQILCEALDVCGLTWITGGNAAWTGQTTNTHDGIDAGVSGTITDSQESWMETAVPGPGTVSFWWSVSSELGWDYLEFRTNGVLDTRISGTVGWSAVIRHVPAGPQTLRWRYVKDAAVSSGQDRGWVDQVTFAPDDPLLAQPGDDLIVSGLLGGPFNPSNKVYTVTNTDPADLSWTAGADQSWVTVTPAGGSLVSGAGTEATVQLNANAQSLGYGLQTATVTFSNLTSGVSQTRVVRLTIFAIRYVDLNSPAPAAPYTNWVTAATNIQDAVDMAAAGDLVLVTNGAYAAGGRVVYGLSNRVAVTKAVMVQSVNGPEATTIAGYQMPLAGFPYGPAAVRCVYLTNGAVLSGFTLTNGATQNSANSDSRTNCSGGGVWCESGSALVTNCVLRGNMANVYGGGAYSGTLNNCMLMSNTNYAYGRGGGAYSSTLNNCTLTGNWIGSAGSGGGACFSTLNNCILMSNSISTYGWGGGAYSSTLNNCTLTGNSTPSGSGAGANGGTLNNCTLNGNSAPAGEGGGAYSSALNNCTLTGNSAGIGGGGAYSSALNNCTLTGNSIPGAYSGRGGGAYYGGLTNCIVYYNTASTGPNCYLVNLNYSCTTPLPGGPGNITNAPLFVNTNAWSNLRLQSNSPCINRGNDAYVTAGTDLDGLPRISGGRVDIGAYEFQGAGLSGFSAWLWQYGLPTDGSADQADTDQDGHNNWQEWIAGTNPTNSVSVLRLQPPQVTPASVTLTWSSVTNRVYSVERATNLAASPGFAMLGTNILGRSDTTSFTDTKPPVSGPAYYRISVQQ